LSLSRQEFGLVGNVWPIEMQLFQSFFAVDWPVEIMRVPNPFSVVSTAVDSRNKQLGNAVVSTAVKFLLKQMKNICYFNCSC